MATAAPVLSVIDLCVYYAGADGDVKACDGVTFDLARGEILGLVGESGSGKSTATSGIMKAVQPPGRIVSGRIILDGEDITHLSDDEMRARRWRKLTLIPQSAMNSLNPTMTIGAQIADAIRAHEVLRDQEQIKARILDLFQRVGLPGRIYGVYPHELSGGMKQRVCIAMSIALDPAVVIADEATSALDVIMQRVVAQTLLKIKAELGVSFVLIGHDMGLMAQVVDRIGVMYSGRLIEIAGVQEIFGRPGHPYSELLIASVPSLTERKPMLITAGVTHDLRDPPSGCIFRLRCPHAGDICARSRPELVEIRPGQSVACHLWQQDEGGGYVRTAV